MLYFIIFLPIDLMFSAPQVSACMWTHWQTTPARQNPMERGSPAVWESWPRISPVTNATRTTTTTSTTCALSSRPSPSLRRLSPASRLRSLAITTSIICSTSTASARIWRGAWSASPPGKLRRVPRAGPLRARPRTLWLNPNCGRWRRLLHRTKSSNISNWGSLGNRVAPPPAAASSLPRHLPQSLRLLLLPLSTRPPPSSEDLFITRLPFIAITQIMATSAPCRVKGSCGTLIHLEWTSPLPQQQQRPQTRAWAPLNRLWRWAQTLRADPAPRLLKITRTRLSPWSSNSSISDPHI